MVYGLGLMVYYVLFSVNILGIRVDGLVCRAWGLWIRVYGLGFLCCC